MLRVYLSSPDTEPASLLFILNSFGKYQGIGPPCDDGSYLGLFARIHVVCILNHDCIHATRAVQVPLGRGLKQFEVFLAPDIPICPEKREDRTTDPCNSGIRSLDSEKVEHFSRSILNVQVRGRTDVGRKGPVGKT